MFKGLLAINQAIGDWDVSSVTSMEGMFGQATVFNQLIGDWDVSSVTVMKFMFNGATVFDQPIGGWNVSKVTNTITCSVVLYVLINQLGVG